MPSQFNGFEDEEKDERGQMENMAEIALGKLKAARLSAELRVKIGNPKQVLLEEAADWNADCIFVVSRSFGSRLERLLIGSTSAAIAERAYCSVEIVRKNIVEG